MNKTVHAVGRLVRSERELTPSEVAQIEAFFGDAVPAEPAIERIPVFGYVAGSDGDRIALGSDHVLDYLEVPAGLTRGSPIALRVVGDSMEPRLFSGETVIVGVGVSPARYGDCVVEYRDGSGMVKQYRGQRDGKVYLYQYNPEREFPVDASSVKAVHAVLFRR
ncbi:S24 family peptidase [Brevundimonas naejangsanensis]|uniref:S24 family peptidase n=1 Tax=Brevundimonas naejangsanensis TaxID=588932 RepID=UPI0026F00184|nr:S24 family peptidase [Brevundimonas naejangsanensis]